MYSWYDFNCVMQNTSKQAFNKEDIVHVGGAHPYPFQI